MKLILIVDNQKINRMILKNIFQSEYTVLEAENGLEALNVLKKVGNVGLILLDLHMPIMNGFEFLKTIRAMSEFENLPVLVVSAHDDLESKRKAFEAGANNQFFYPIDKEVMEKTVSDYFSLGEYKLRGEYFENIYNSLSCGVIHYRLKPEFTLSNINKKALELLGYTKKELFEIKWSELEGLNPKDVELAKNIKLKEEQLEFGKPFSYNFEVFLKDNEPKWIHCTQEIILDVFGQPLYQKVLTDITQEKLLQEKLVLSETRNKLLLEQTDNITFEWDCKKNRAEFFNNAENKYGIKSEYNNFPEGFIDSNIVYKKDQDSLLEAFEKIKSEKSYYDEEFRVVGPNGKFIWFEIVSKAIKDENGKVKKILGLLKNIDSYKKKIEKAQAEARRDSLTGLYNRQNFEKISNEAICDGKNGAMFIIDIDNFKNVNDSRGHLVGDDVLRSLSHILTSVFREKDIVARTGGDEFGVLLKGKIDLNVIQKKATEILDFVRVLSLEKYVENEISVSVGVCMFNKLTLKEHGSEIFKQLYKKADAEMYKAKHNGKGRYNITEL